ncbi:hypothetical protein IQ07DRAFT_650055 [Pyrenochaeta sp. DS3sAY3a]|nr:hypothetical protein IQ07DRAFT_650055 [Pyrenochaeta sp. DS3sAY3a]
MPHAENDPFVDPAKRIPRKLVLCFDGTGNQFMGNTSDTNIVKLYDKLDRKDPNQYHYYQTGIGTYDIDGGSINKTFLGGIRSKISRTIDTGFATTFDAHVIAGYRFIMRYYKEGDKIYIFGFSRGAFTARFLARMIFRVGLLSEGNEEQIPFAYDLYQQYEKGKATGDKVAAEEFRNKLYAFKMTFCRCDQINPALGDAPENLGVKVHFLGMFDCVSSVAVLDSMVGSVPKAVSVVGTAHHVRHAVAVDEHRVKFRAALLQQDDKKTTASGEDIKEVWFPGNHGDVGGGWPAPKPDDVEAKRTWWQTIRGIFVTDTDSQAAKQPAEDYYQMSDIPLAWMIRELELLGEKDAASAIRWSPRKEGFKRHFYERKVQAYNSPMHSTLKISGGSSLFKVMLWNFMECLPIRRWELEFQKDANPRQYEWALLARPNLRGTRDIPTGAYLHDSLLRRLQNHASTYRPKNNQGDKSPPSLLFKEFDEGHFTCVSKDNGEDQHEDSRGVHSIYKLK